MPVSRYDQDYFSVGKQVEDMKLREDSIVNEKEKWTGFILPSYDRKLLRKNTHENPEWLHFGAGNIFRAFPAMLAQRLIEKGRMKAGIICCEGYDEEIIEKCFRPYDDLAVIVTLNSDGTRKKEVVGSVTESLTLRDDNRLREIFRSASLQMVSFTITEKGYSLRNSKNELLLQIAEDIKNGPQKARSLMAKLVSYCLDRFENGAYPLALVSMDNCSHNGDRLRNALWEIAEEWERNGFVDKSFLSYLSGNVSFPWSMIDKITPRPDERIREELLKDGLEDMDPVVTSKSTYTAPYVNTEKPQYLVIEDAFPNGRPALEDVGVIFTDRETVDKVEKMKVCTCLNPLHTALAVFGCLLGYDYIYEEMKDKDLVALVNKIGYQESLPVVVNPGVLNPEEFIKEVLEVRFPNPFIPDTPQRIATDTSQKLGIRFGETLKAYALFQKKDCSFLKGIPLVFAGWLRYLLAVDDRGEPFELSPDPMLDAMKEELKGITLGSRIIKGKTLKSILSDEKIFAVNLYEVGLGNIVEDYFSRLIAGKGAVRKTLQEVLGQADVAGNAQ